MGMSKSYYSISTLQKRGATLAEFAITTAMMATLAVTAIPKMSSLTEDTKGSKSRENVDKILFASKKFYEETAKSEGRGRFPGQEKYNFKVGWYDNESKLLSDLNKFDSYTYNKGWRWKSVFGGWWKEAPRPEGSLITNDQIEDCENCPSNLNGHLRFREMFGGILKSPFQDGHYIYAVIPGGGTGDDFYPPTMYVADLENPSQINNLIVP